MSPRPAVRLLSADLLRVEVTVPLDVEGAFALLTEGTSGWWPPRSLTGSVTFDAEVGGRWGERTTDGAEGTYGAVTLWDPPRHVRLTWEGGDGTSHVDVTVADVDDDLTTVIVEHRGLHHHTPEERAWLRGDDGWWAILRAYATAARGA